MSNLRLLEEVGTEAPEASSVDKGESDLATKLLITALSALSKRAVIALASLQTLLAIGAVLFLAYTILTVSAPSMVQVIGLAIFAGFVLSALWLTRR